MDWKEHGQALRTALLFIILYAAILGGSWLYLKSDDLHAEIVKPAPVQKVRHAAPAARQASEESSSRLIRKEYTVDKGDSFFEILKENGVSGEEALDIIRAVRPVFNTAKIHPGNTITLVFCPDNESLCELQYEISDLKRLVVSVKGDKIRARRMDVEQEEHVVAEDDAQPPEGKDQTAAVPAAPRAPAEERLAHGLRQVEVKIKKGQNLFDILRNRGVSAAEIDAFAKATRKVYNPRGIRPGNTITAWFTLEAPTHVKRLTYEIDDRSYLDVRSEGDSAFKARIRTLELDTVIEHGSGTITNSLYESARAEGINHEVVMELVDIYAWNINFFNDIQPGDTYSVLYEKYYVKDRFKGFGRVLAANFVNQGESHVAIYYENERRGIRGYYDENGKPLKKMFLKAPLNYRRISSGFTHSRKHPIFNVNRPHLGVDYAAPTGTPVCALGAGKVAFRGWIRGYGNTIRVKHPEGYVSHYAHLSRFSKGLAVGKKVDQGDVIGYVGSTGYSTGPHLDFRVSRHGTFVNPLALKSVNGPALHGKALAEFKRMSAQRMAMLSEPSMRVALDHLDRPEQAGPKIAAGR
ncbi:MAG TPA: M23 family metallopeptidase [Deltaproteobacteria bacterium]|nr:M23 family metallopeptidase [Deltaproteobacteria bacterium]